MASSSYRKVPHGRSAMTVTVRVNFRAGDTSSRNCRGRGLGDGALSWFRAPSCSHAPRAVRERPRRSGRSCWRSAGQGGARDRELRIVRADIAGAWRLGRSLDRGASTRNLAVYDCFSGGAARRVFGRASSGQHTTRRSRAGVRALCPVLVETPSSANFSPSGHRRPYRASVCIRRAWEARLVKRSKPDA